MKRSLAFLLIIIFISIPQAAYGESALLAEEYMRLNGMERPDKPGSYYLSLDLPTDSPISMISIEDALQLKNGFLYFGANWCPHCRNFIYVLMHAAKNVQPEHLYAASAENIKTLWILDENNEPTKIRNAGEDYYKLLHWLSPFLSDYVLTDSQGEKHSTGELRIYMPRVFYIQEGVPVSCWSLSDVEGFERNEDAHALWSLNQQAVVYQSIRAFLLQIDVELLNQELLPLNCDCDP